MGEALTFWGVLVFVGVDRDIPMGEALVLCGVLGSAAAVGFGDSF